MDLTRKPASSHDSAIKEASDADFDMNLIELNLSLSPEQRLEQHESALKLVFEMEAARETRNHEKPQ